MRPLPLLSAFCLSAFLAFATGATAAIGAPLVVVNDSAKEIVPIDVSLTVGPNEPNGNNSSFQATAIAPSDEVQAAVGAEKYTAMLEMGSQADGNSYYALLRPEPTPKFLSNNNGRNDSWQAVLLKKDAAGKFTKLNEGLVSYGDVAIPLVVPDPTGKPFDAKLILNVNGRTNDMPTATISIRGGREASGSIMLTNAKLTVTVDMGVALKYSRDMAVNYRLEPFDKTVPVLSGAGRIGDLVTLGSATVTVGGIAQDFSSVSLLQVSNTLDQAAKGLQLGSRMPSFSQVELFERKTVSWRDVLDEARRTGYVVMVFGDLADSNQQQWGYGGRPSELPLDRRSIVETVSAALANAPKVIFVTRQIALKELYEEQRNQRPGYWVLSDFANPLSTSFSMPNRGGGYMPYNPPSGEGNTLRALLSLPGDMVSVLVFDADGKLVYLRTVAGPNALPALTGANEAMRGGAARAGT